MRDYYEASSEGYSKLSLSKALCRYISLPIVSDQSAQLVPGLGGDRQWAVAMKALIQSTGMWAYPMGNIEREHFPDDDDEYKALPATQKAEILASITEFEKNDGMVLGQITLRLSPTI